MKNLRIIALNCENKDGFNVYLDFSGQLEFLMWHRHNAQLFSIMKDGIKLNDLKRIRPHKVNSKYSCGINRDNSVKHERVLKHLLTVVDEYLYERQLVA